MKTGKLFGIRPMALHPPQWRNGGMAEWRNGGMAEWRNGGMNLSPEIRLCSSSVSSVSSVKSVVAHSLIARRTQTESVAMRSPPEFVPRYEAAICESEFQVVALDRAGGFENAGFR
jgi:hypothetical protein